MKLTKAEQEFRNPRVFYPDPKNIDLDRVLVNLCLLLRCDGQRPATRGRAKRQVEDVAYHVRTLASKLGNTGFDEQPEVAKAWLESDVFDIVNRGKGTEREAVASLRPLHLDAAKIRVAKHCRDYNVADHLYAAMEHGAQQTLRDLRAYLDKGRDPRTHRYDGSTQLDLETLTVLKLVEGAHEFHPSGEHATSEPPVCIGQARVMCDDVQRLLAYQDEIPRGVMVEYLRTLFGLHTALYTLRLARQLPSWIRAREAHGACLACPVRGSSRRPFEGCPYEEEYVVDMGTTPGSTMATLAKESATAAYASLYDFIGALFAVNQLLRYLKDHRSELGLEETPANAVGLLSSAPEDFETWFRLELVRIRERNEAGGEELKPEEKAILEMDLPSFERFIELVTQVRARHHRSYLVQLLDTLLQKNSAHGALVQGRSRSQARRWKLGGRLLELLVQLAVLRWEEADGEKRFYSRPVLIDDFVAWLRQRYGLAVFPGEAQAPSTVAEHRAFRVNTRDLKAQLREIGFFDDLSDAFNAQTIRPRCPSRRPTAMPRRRHSASPSRSTPTCPR